MQISKECLRMQSKKCSPTNFANSLSIALHEGIKPYTLKASVIFMQCLV